MPRVLVVDDSAVVRAVVSAALEPYGIETVHAENGAVALERGVTSRWDLIFLDVTMPVMDGPTALRLLRARGVKSPVVLITTVKTSSVVADAVRLGSVDYISKPIAADQVQAIARKLLKIDEALMRPRRVLLQHVSPGLPARLRACLPSYVALDASSSLAESLELAERGEYALCAIETGGPLDEARAIAGVIRRSLPRAAMLGIAHDVGDHAMFDEDDALDAALPSTFGDDVARALVYPCFVRPLVFVDGMTMQAAGFQGPTAYRTAYLTMLVRALVGAAERLEATLDPIVDLRDVPLDVEDTLTLVARADDALRAQGAAPRFLLGAAAAAETPRRLPRVLLG